FEALRDASDRTLKKTGARPKILLTNLGAPADCIARNRSARNFLEAGGVEPVNSEPGADLAAAFKQSGAKLACLCSSDEVYAKEAFEAAKALTVAEAAQLYLAGRPGELAEALDKAGVKNFIYAGCDVLATLRATQ